MTMLVIFNKYRHFSMVKVTTPADNIRSIIIIRITSKLHPIYILKKLEGKATRIFGSLSVNMSYSPGCTVGGQGHPKTFRF
jgi:hypothetical protein